MLRTTETVFLGVVVNPKTKAPVYVTRRSYKDRTVDIWTVSEASLGKRDRFYIDIGSGYLESDSGDSDYLAAVHLTGFPRSHTPEGLKGVEKGGGYGTCLYTGLVMLATAAHAGDLQARELAGDGDGVCSDEETRSPSATRWWRKALELKLTYQESGDVEESEPELEEIEDENLEDYMTRLGRQRCVDQIISTIENAGDWSVRDVSIRGTVYRQVASGRRGGEITADVYTYDSAVKHNLIAVRDVEIGTPIVWARNPAEALDAYKDVILAMNVANEDTVMMGKLARLASEHGATESELAAFMMRNRFGVDSWRTAAPSLETYSPEAMDDPELMRMLGVAPMRRPRRLPPPEEDTEQDRERVLDMLARAGTARNPHRLLPLPRRNPPETPRAGERAAIDKNLVELDKRRADLGWTELEALS